MKHTCLGILILLLIPVFSYGQSDFVPLIGIPGLDPGGLDSNTYINALYIIAISLAAALAVVKLLLAGLRYIVSDVIPSKEQAKKDIRNALIGLLIVIGAVLVLNTINPNLTDLDVLRFEQLSTAAPDRVIVNRTGSPATTPITPGTQVGTDNNSCLNPSQLRAFEARCPTQVETRPVSPGCVSARCVSTGTNTSGSPATTSTSVSRTISFRGNGIDTSIEYRVNDPAEPALGVTSDGELHNKIVQIVSLNASGNGFVVVDTTTGDEYFLGCALLVPEIPGC